MDTKCSQIRTNIKLNQYKKQKKGALYQILDEINAKLKLWKDI